MYSSYAWYFLEQSQGRGIFHDRWTGRTAVPGYNATISACEKSCEWRLPLHLLQHLDADVAADVVRCWDHESACMWVHGMAAMQNLQPLWTIPRAKSTVAMLVETRQCHTQHTSESENDG